MSDELVINSVFVESEHLTAERRIVKSSDHCLGLSVLLNRAWAYPR